MNVRIVLVDARPAARAALRAMVEADWGWQVVGEAVDGLEGVRLSRLEAADVLLVDAGVKGLDLNTMFELLGPESGTLVVGLLDFPHQHSATRGVAVLKGVPSVHLRDVIVSSLGKAGIKEVASSPDVVDEREVQL